MVSHNDPLIVCLASTGGVCYALCRTCGAHSPVVGNSAEALALLDDGGSARACYLQMPLFDKAFAEEAFAEKAHTEQERVWPGAA